MIIKNKIAYVFDVEVFPNCFTCATKNTETKDIIVYEISERKNDAWDIINLFTSLENIYCGYNL